MCLNHADHAHGHEVAAPKLVDLTNWKRRDVFRAVAAGSLMLLAPGCATNPETGRSQLMLVDEGSLSRLAFDAWQEQKAQTPISRDAGLNSRLRNVGQRIAQSSGRGDQPWEFVVFDTPEKNAFVLPGNKVGFYRGLMEISDRDDHIGTVLGHEVGHVTGRHAGERFSQNMAAQLGLLAGQAYIGTRDMSSQTKQLAMAGLGLGVQVGLLMPFSRQQELEADLLGIDYMHRAGYDVRQAIPFWERMAGSGGRRPPEFLSTHPDPTTRIQAIRQHINNRGYAVV
jgi:predicted Zn-dependent protease